MRLVLFDKPGQPALPGLLTERGVVSIADVAPLAHTPHATMEAIIDGFEPLRAALWEPEAIWALSHAVTLTDEQLTATCDELAA